MRFPYHKDSKKVPPNSGNLPFQWRGSWGPPKVYLCPSYRTKTEVSSKRSSSKPVPTALPDPNPAFTGLAWRGPCHPNGRVGGSLCHLLHVLFGRHTCLSKLSSPVRSRASFLLFGRHTYQISGSSGGHFRFCLVLHQTLGCMPLPLREVADATGEASHSSAVRSRGVVRISPTHGCRFELPRAVLSHLQHAANGKITSAAEAEQARATTPG